MGQILSNIATSICGDQPDVEETLFHQLLPLTSSTPERSTPYSCPSQQLELKQSVVHQVSAPSPSAPDGTFASVYFDHLQPKERQVDRLLPPSSSTKQLQPNDGKRVPPLSPPTSAAAESITASVCSSQLEPEERIFAPVCSDPFQAINESQAVQLPFTPSSVPQNVPASLTSSLLRPGELLVAPVISNPLRDKASKKLDDDSQVLPGNPQETEKRRETHQGSEKSKQVQPTGNAPGEVERPIVVKEKRVKHYTSNQKILLVGEGDFSFSACLAEAFGSAANMVATSLNSIKFLKKNYWNASGNIQKLKMLGAEVRHGVDATKIGDKNSIFKGKIFDRIIFNFPHAGFSNKNESREVQIWEHQTLVHGFLKSAKKLIRSGGEIHISHMTSKFHNEWKLEELGIDVGLGLLGTARFKRSDYPGYCSKYGFGGDGDFDCNPSSTYMFGFPISPSGNGS